MRSLLLGLALALPLSLPTASPAAPPARDASEDVHVAAQRLVDAKSFEEARDLLRRHLSSTAGDARAHELLGKALSGLGELDEASHHLSTALRIYRDGGDARGAKDADRALRRADPLESRRDRLRREITSKLLDATEKLFELGHAQRALDLLERVEPVAAGKDAPALRRLLEEIRSSFEEVDLDEAGAEKTDGDIWPLITFESEHYVLEANLERELVELVAATMDDIHGYYVELYLDGDPSQASGNKATIRVHPTRDAMLAGWQGGSAPEGWWSPGENKVTCYDTRTTTGSLDWMLETLFHEASHQFMTQLERKGGSAPAWLNEGTASFFEGAKAMADHRVLWPDAAIKRLANLTAMLSGAADGPTIEQVIGYSGAGSYPGEYYPWGWGLVYFLQQFEDPETLQYVYRPLYARYREEITSSGGDSRTLFEEVFLGPDSPLGHESLADFDRDWRGWITDEVSPLHRAVEAKRRELRLAHVERYAAAARAAAGEKKAPVSELELWTRALGHIDYVRNELDDEDRPDIALLTMQADIFERQERKEAAAPLVEQLLRLADEAYWSPSAEEYEALEQRLKELDRRNYALRRAESTRKSLVRSARKLFEDYQKGDAPMPMRSYTLAARIGQALGDAEVLEPAARELREDLRTSGVSFGEVHSLVAAKKHWKSIFSAGAAAFRHEPGRLELRSVRPHGMLNTAVELSDEYELRATFVRDDDLYRSTCHGLVIAGAEEGDWLVFGLLKSGKAGLWRLISTSGGGVTTTKLETFYLDPAPGDADDLEVRVRVSAGGRILARVGECEPLESRVPEGFPRARHAGVYAKDGTTLLMDPVLELY